MGIFQDDEFAVYNPNQQRIRYLVEFTVRGDLPLKEHSICEVVTVDDRTESQESGMLMLFVRKLK